MEKIEILPAGSVVGAFKILKKLGSGGSGVVYLAKQMAMDKVVAVKILHQDMAENPVYIRNFVHEARMAAKLDHPNIIQALDVGSSGNICYFAMEYVNGVSLEHIRLKSIGNISGINKKIDLVFFEKFKCQPGAFPGIRLPGPEGQRHCCGGPDHRQPGVL